MTRTARKPIRLRLSPSPRADRVRSDATLARMAKALGHPARVAIVRLLLRRGECICGDIVEHIPLAQATVSQHLKVLKNAGWIRGEVDGPRVCYCAAPDAGDKFLALTGALVEERSGR